MPAPYKALTPYTPRYVEIFYAAAVPDCSIASASSDTSEDSVEV